MMVIQDDVTGLGVDLTELEGDVNFLFDETVIQDERLFSLETETEEIYEQLVLIDDDLESMFLECCVTCLCSFLRMLQH